MKPDTCLDTKGDQPKVVETHETLEATVETKPASNAATQTAENTAPINTTPNQTEKPNLSPAVKTNAESSTTPSTASVVPWLKKAAHSLEQLAAKGRQAMAKTTAAESGVSASDGQTTDTPKSVDPLFQTSQVLRQWSGGLTNDLKRVPGVSGIGHVPLKQAPAATVTSVCGYCSTGCGLNIHLDADGNALGLTPQTHYPVNMGMACPKGWEALAVLDAPDRATVPLLRNADGRLVPSDWDTALKTMAKSFKAIQAEHGKASVAFLSTGQMVTEEMALLGAVAKFGMGMVHGDGNTRQCMATAVTAYKQSFGFDAPPYTYEDYEQSDVLVFVGANPCIAHPIMWQRVWENRQGKQIVVIDPRRTETASFADQHLPIRPKSDLVFFYGLAKALLDMGAVDESFVAKHTNDFDAFTEHLQSFTAERVQKEAGIDPDALQTLAKTIAQGKAVSYWWTMGVNQSHEGTRVAQAIINLALMTGNIGKPGTGANSITGQCNAMGSRLFSNTTNLLGGHDFTDENDRNKVANILGIDSARIPDQNSWSYHEIIDGIEQGTIKGLWVIATNGAHSWIHSKRFKQLMGKLDCLVVQDMYTTTETAQLADIVLPAAGWGEKDGTFINSERRIGPVTKVKQAPGQALSDFAIFKLVAHYWGCGSMFQKWANPEAAFQLLAQLSEGQPCDITGIRDYAMLHQHGGIQWPYAKDQAEQDVQSNTHQQHRRLFADGQFCHADGKAKFIFDQPRPMAEPTDADHPFILLTGRGTSSQWHTQTRTGKSEVLTKLYPKDPYVEIHPDDAQAHGLKQNDWVNVASRRGHVNCRAVIMPSVQPGQLFMPMHHAKTNELTFPSFDPHSKQPSYKACAVSLQRLI